MSSLTVEYKCSKHENLESIIKKFGENCLSISDQKGKNLYKKTNKTNKTLKSADNVQCFFDKYNPQIDKYSIRALILTTHKCVSKEDKVIKSDNLVKPLYYNEKLKGWITSIDNNNSLLSLRLKLRL